MIDFNEGLHEYTLEGIHIPSMSELLIPVTSDFEYPARYAERGTAVHTLTELWDQGLFFPELADDELTTYMFGYEDFHDTHDVEIISIEKMVFNKELFYAGRLDRIWLIDNKKHLTDVKTGGKYKQHLFQVCGYKMASEEVEEVSNLYINPYSQKLETWSKKDVLYGEEMVRALSLIYWDNHRRDRKLVEKILGVNK